MRPLEREIELDGLVALLADRHRAFSAYQRLVAAGPEALRALRQGIDSADPRVRSKCCQVLDELADATSFALLVGMLGDGHRGFGSMPSMPWPAIGARGTRAGRKRRMCDLRRSGSCATTPTSTCARWRPR